MLHQTDYNIIDIKYIKYMIYCNIFYYALLGVNYQLNPSHMWMGGGGGGLEEV